MPRTVIETRRLRKRYPAVTAVDDVDLKVEEGEVLGLVGPNGAGKTTLLKMLSTLLEPTSGSIEIMGMDARKHPIAARRALGYLPDFFNLYGDLKLWEMLWFFADVYEIPEEDIERRVAEALELVGLTAKRDDFARNLSRGMAQRLGVATLLVRDSPILLLDEPASGLDPKARIGLREVLKKLAAEGRTIIISSHILTELEDFCTHIAVMGRGKLELHDGVASIQSGLCGKTVVKLGMLEKNAAILTKAVAKLDYAKIVSGSGTAFKIEIDGGADAIAKLNKDLVSAGVGVVMLLEEKSSLEDIFMDVTAAFDEDGGGA